VEQIARYVKAVVGVPDEGGAPQSAGRLALLDPRTGEVEAVRAARIGATPASWSPDRRRLLFSQLDGDLRQLYELDLERGEVRRITRGPGAHAAGCYGPDGRYVYSSARVEAGQVVSRILMTRPGGLDPAAISPGPADYGPACAPDGSAVVWVRQGRRGREEIVSRVPPQGGSVATLAPGRDPAFSPDGRYVVYSAPSGRARELYRMRPDGSGRAPVGSSAVDEWQPAVSPDGGYVAYVGEEGYHKRLYLRRFDGSGDRILFDDGDAERPVW
jgi:Tol biopolymer transport system component